MATVTPTLHPSPNRSFLRVSYEGFTTSGDVGTAVELAGYRDRSVQILGNFGTGGEITIEGSNDGGTTWAALTDPQANSIVKTAAALEQIQEVSLKIRPRCSAGSGADIDVWFFFSGRDGS